MPIQALNRLAARVAGSVPLRTVLIVPFVLQILGTVGLVGYLSYRNGQEAVNDVASRYRREISDRVQLYLKTYLATPHLINRINVDAVRFGQLNLQDDAKVERYLVWQLQQFDSVDSIIFGSNRGNLIAAYRLPEKALILVSERSDTSKIYVYASDSLGNRGKLQEIFRQPDVRERPWYKAAASAGKPTWTQIFQLGDKSDLTINANRPVYDVANNKLLGVFSINLELTKISKFLQSLQVGKSGKVFILERNGLLIANSSEEKPYIVSSQKEFKRLKATESSNPLISATSRYLTKKFGNELGLIKNPEKLDFKIENQRQFVQIVPFRDEFGLDWLIVVVVPESDFMEQINSHTRTTILLCSGALFGSICAGIITARWITQPILRLNQATKDIAKGEWNKTLEIQRFDEVRELANSFKTMASHLQQSFTELQSLNQALAQRESQLRQFLDAIPVGVSIYEVTGKVTYFNPMAKRLLGREIILESTLEELAANYQLYRQNQLYPTEELPALRALKGETVFLNDIELHRDGKILPFEVHATPISDKQGNIIYAIVAFTDITDRKQVEKLSADYNRNLECQVTKRTAELIRANEQIQGEKELRETIYNESADAIFLVDPTTRLILDCNRRAVELFEVTGKEDLIGIQGRTLQRHPYTSEEIDQISKEMYQKGFWSREIEYITRTGKVFWGNIAGKPVRITGKAVTLVRITDISDKKLAEAALQASQARFAGILEIANDAVITVNASQRITLFNQGAEKIFGYRADEVLGQPLDLLLPADMRAIHRQHVTTFVESVGKARPMGGRGEIFARRKDGTEFPAEASISKLEINGEKILTTILRDISDHKQAEQAFLKSEERFQEIARTISQFFFVRSASSGQFLYASPAYEKIWGRTCESLYQNPQSWLEALHPDDRESVLDSLRRQFQGNSVRREYRIIQPDGSIRWVVADVAVVRDNMGQPLRFIGVAEDISDRKRAEDSLREKEEQLQLALEGSGDGLWDWKTQTGEVYYSPRYLEMLGYEADELPQKVSTWERLIHPDDKAWVMEILNAHLADGSVPYQFDYRLLTKSGEWKWIANYGKVVAHDENGVPLRMTGTHRDVSDKKLAEQQLHWREALLRSMTSASPLAFYVVDNRTDAILYFNHRFCEIWSIEHLEERMQQGILTNNDIMIACIPLLKDVAGFAESCQPLQSEENRILIEDEIPFIDGRTIRRFSAQIRERSDRYFGRLYIFEDITERKQSQTALQQAKEAAEAANQAKSTFLANMSHELRTPLNGILGYAQILQADKNCTPKQKTGVDIIHQCGTHLLTLINDILDLSKIEAGKLELYSEDFDFFSLLKGLSEIFHLKAAQKSITFTYLPLNRLPKMIHADEKRLRQILMNLLSNAVKFTDAGSVTFKVEVIDNEKQEPLPITNYPLPIPNQLIRFQVEDTGVGIASEQLEKIFLPFEQVGNSSRRPEGTGLGLAITQRIVELMGGKIFVESTPEVGSKFGFDLDVPVVSIPMDSTPIKTTDTIIGYSGSKRKILIVDDRWENRTVFINILKPIGFELEQAADGEDGLEKAWEFQPDVMLVDLVMPVMDGYEMMRQLRQLPEFQDTIIVAISANVFESDILHSLDAGCNDFLPKPVRAEDLLDKIQHYLNLSWIYESEARSEKLEDESSRDRAGRISRADRSTLTEMSVPPKEELLALYNAAISGVVDNVEEEVMRLQHLPPIYSIFVARIQELATDFEYEEITKIIDRY